MLTIFGGTVGAMIDVLLADDHPLILRGLRDLLSPYRDLCIVGTETDGARVVDAVLDLDPDVLVLDYEMPGKSGVEIAREVTAVCPGTRVLVLSMHSGVPYVAEAIKSGASGYVPKCVESEEIVRAIRAVHAGRRHLSRPLDEREVESWLRRVAEPGGESSALTRRELDVLCLVVKGHTSTEIADRLRIGRRTVESHRASLLCKLGARNQADLVREAVVKGLIPLAAD
ncbi:MAG TPA: response regulator transcription factor [Gammaproteobacteria bacterium]|nr:response regulator transcription factor [Gammaproteobacteria bacterium]